MTLVQCCAERFRRVLEASPGRPRMRRCWLIRQTTALCRTEREVARMGVPALAHPRTWAEAAAARAMTARANTATQVAVRRQMKARKCATVWHIAVSFL